MPDFSATLLTLIYVLVYVDFHGQFLGDGSLTILQRITAYLHKRYDYSQESLQWLSVVIS